MTSQSNGGRITEPFLDQPDNTLLAAIEAPLMPGEGTRFHLHGFALRERPAATRRSWFPIDMSTIATKHVERELYLK